MDKTLQNAYTPYPAVYEIIVGIRNPKEFINHEVGSSTKEEYNHIRYAQPCKTQRKFSPRLYRDNGANDIAH
jgi:hypothetical protein